MPDLALRISRGGFFQSIKSRCLGEEARRGTDGRSERDAPCLSAGTTATGASRRRVARCRARGGWSPACFARISPATPPTSSSRRCAIRLSHAKRRTALPYLAKIAFSLRFPPLSAGFWGSEAGANDESRPSDVSVAFCLLYTSPSPRDQRGSRMPSSA